ncbi:TPA: hypothetical protein N0F65_005363 [Lagenidium giganteum]|uniref:Alpha/beta hydrolase fold-3 domain-containing protein n=1 Tax=Lagenidium giganteum TaxID=4803 RepID=A0AAV2YKY8_9STRA|nr:TPA: hypothetical protein N0F65_005363 [Lagenidium giganteum]
MTQPTQVTGVRGYRAPYAPAITVVSTVLVLLLNASSLDPPLSPVVILAVAAALYAIHEAVRVFCVSFMDVVLLTLHVTGAVTLALVQYVARGCQTKLPNDWTLGFELFHTALRSIGDRNGHWVAELPNIQIMRRNCDLAGHVTGWWSCLQHGTRVVPFVHRGLEHLWVTSENNEQRTSDTDRFVVVVYHGGGYGNLCPRTYIDFANRLLSKVHAHLAASKSRDQDVVVDVLLSNYRKIPEVRFPMPALDALATFDFLTEELHVPEHRILLVGDSAGAGLCMSVLLRLRDAGRRLPLTAALVSPYVDYSGNDDESDWCYCSKSMCESIRLNYVETYDDPATWLDASAVDCDLRGLPPLFIQSGD